MKIKFLAAAALLIFISSCVKDRVTSTGTNVIPPVVVSGDTLIYYNNGNLDTPYVLFTPTSALMSGDSLAYAGAYVDTVQPGTSLNAQGTDTILTSVSSAIRLRNPAGTFTLTLPTTGYKNIVLKYAVQASSKGSKTNTVTYTTDGVNYVNTALSATFGDPANYSVDTSWKVIALDFTSDPAVNNNSKFKIRIDFSNAASTTTGNDRIDNITLWGVKQ
jgi:hypothetical protein